MTHIHILRAPATTTDAERAQLANLDKYQRRYLSRRVCAACEQPLDRAACAAVMGEACAESVRIERRRRCLEGYKPRPGARKEGS